MSNVIQLRPPTSPFLQDNRIYRDGILLEKVLKLLKTFYCVMKSFLRI